MENLVRTDLLPLGFAWYYIIFCIILVKVGLYSLKKKVSFVGYPRNTQVAIFCLYGLVNSLFFWFVLQFLARFIFFATPWSLVLLGIIAGFGFEGLLLLYKHETLIAGDKYGKRILPLRLTFFLLLIFVLGEPVLRRNKTVTIDRQVVILVDDSDSMHLVDRQWSDSEKMYMGKIFGFGGSESWIDSAKINTIFDNAIATSMDIGSGGKFLYDTYDKYSNPELREYVDESEKEMELCINTIQAVYQMLDEYSTIERVASYRSALNAIKSSYQNKLLGYLRKKPKDFGKSTFSIFLKLNTSLIGVYQKYQAELPEVLDVVANTMYNDMDDLDKKVLDEIVETERYKLADRIIYGVGTDVSVLNKLNETYKTEGYIFGRNAKSIYLDLPNGGQGTETSNYLVAENVYSNNIDVLLFRSETDYATSLEKVLKEVPLDSLAGILMITDGCDNGKSDPLPVCRRLGGLGIPVSSIIIGGTEIPKDIAIINVAAPDSVYLDDKVRIKAEIQVHGLVGKVIKVNLLEGDKVVDEQEMVVASDDYKEELRFSHMPTDQGITHYTVETSIIEGELSSENNSWGLDVAVSDDRTNVLLVDSYPRWEFRYLRNLFYGRDKSINLQYILFNPDTITEQKKRPLIYASASRKFGDSEATVFPSDEKEWRMFDAIILGDINPEDLSDLVIAEIKRCVEERGALLVVSAGARFMPHHYENQDLKDLLPINYAQSTRPMFNSPEKDYKIKLTAAGREHPVMQQSESSAENDEIWASMPVMRWRMPVESLKPGATVLAYAQPGDDDGIDFSATQEERELYLEKRLEQEVRNALVVVHRYGQGTVVMLPFDRTWRWRYGVGDVYHHKFWGQLMRWGAGENLRSGGEHVRLGTDKLVYSPGDNVKVVSRLIDKSYSGVNKKSFGAVLKYDGKTIMKKEFEYREDSNGYYDLELKVPDASGYYTISLVGDIIDELRAEGSVKDIETIISVKTLDNPIERSILNADSTEPSKIAATTGGKLLTPTDIMNLDSIFGEGNREEILVQEKTLWDKWPLFILMSIIIGFEWFYRKKGGLA